MRLMLAHTNDARGQQIWERLSKIPNVTLHARCYGLTDAFNSIEHRPPHIVLYSAELVLRPEFDAMESLCKCLSVRWMIVGKMPPDKMLEAPLLDPSETDDGMVSALTRCMRSNPIQEARAPAGLFRASQKMTSNKIVLIGSSTGGIDALLSVLGAFPENCPPTMIVQHTGAGFGAGLARVLNQKVEPLVRQARQGERLEPGHILIASGSGSHLRLSSENRLTCRLDQGERVSGHCPSVDALFESAVPVARRVCAVVLTGMGKDGAKGLLALRQAGAHTISQDENTSVVYGMPREAAKLGAAKQILPLHSIGPALLQATQRQATN